MSEAAKYLHLYRHYLTGCGIDIGSQGSPVIDTAIGIDLPEAEFNYYNGGHPPRGPIQMRLDGLKKLPFDSNSLGFLFSSHLLEDSEYWGPVLIEWVRVIKPGGHLVILIPDKKLWAEAMRRGQLGNPAHKHEGTVGELSTYAEKLGVEVLHDQLTDQFPGDYTIMAVFRKR